MLEWPCELYRLKNRINAYFPDLQAHTEGRDVLFVFDEDADSAMRKTCDHDADTEGIHPLRVANIICRVILKKKTSFTCSFDSRCQELSVINSLVGLVSMILYSLNIKTQFSYSSKPQAALILSQLLTFNTYARCRDDVR